MKLTKQINLQDAEALSRLLQAEKASRERFSIDAPVEDLANGIYAAYLAQVRSRGGRMTVDDDTKQHILEAAEWLADANGKSGLMLCGLYGNGKTTLAIALSRFIEYVTEQEYGYDKRIIMPVRTAKDICSLFNQENRKDNTAKIDNIKFMPMLIIDDMGEEPTETLVYGMPRTPIIDIISARYTACRTTVITTNLQTPEIKKKYGVRIYDRLTEMCQPIVFTNDSYRK